jgi:hypothetical protein
VTAYVGNVLKDVDAKFGALKPEQQKKACQRLIDPTVKGGMPGFENAWDIVPLGQLGFVPPVWHFKSGTQGSGGACATTVGYNGQCYQSRDVNYLLWGKMMGLCGAKFKGEAEAAKLLGGASPDALTSMIGDKKMQFLVWAILKASPALWKQAIQEGTTLYEQKAYSLSFALHVAYARKQSKFSGASDLGSVYFTQLGYTGTAPTIGGTYSMMDLGSGATATALLNKLPDAAKKKIQGWLAPSVTVADPSCTKACPIVNKNNTVTDTNYGNWKWLPFHDPIP